MSDQNPPDQPFGGSPQSPPYGQQPPYPYDQPQSPYGAPQQPYGSPQSPYGPPQSPYGAPDSAPPGTYPPAPQKRRVGRVLAIVGGSLAVLLLLCCVGAYLFGGRDIINEGSASLSTPDTVAGLKKSTRTELQPVVDEMSSGLKKDAGLDDTIAAFYEDPKSPRKIVMLVGGTKLLLRPKSELDDAFKGLNTGGTRVKSVTDVDAGEMGGVARCGVADASGASVTFCAWADHGSLVIGGFFNRPINESAALLRQIRKEILKR